MEILEKIAEYLDFQDLKALSLVSRTFAESFSRGFVLKSRLRLSLIPGLDATVFSKSFRSYQSVLIPFKSYIESYRDLMLATLKISSKPVYLTVARSDRNDFMNYEEFYRFICRFTELKGLKFMFKFKPTSRIPEYHELYLQKQKRVKCEVLCVYSLAAFFLMGYMVEEVKTLIIRTEQSNWLLNSTFDVLYVFLQFNASTLKSLVIIGDAMQVLSTISFPENMLLKNLVIQDPGWEGSMDLLNEKIKSQEKLEYLKIYTPQATIKEPTLKIISQLPFLDTLILDANECQASMTTLPQFTNVENLSFTRFQDNVIPFMQKFPSAKKIEFRTPGDFITIEDEDEIRIQPTNISNFNLTFLTHLEFRDVKRHGDLFTTLNAPNLTYFYVEKLSPRQASALSKSCPNIRQISIGEFTHFKELLSIYHQFKKLNVFKCFNLLVKATKTRKQEGSILKKLLPVLTTIQNRSMEFAEYYLSTNLTFENIAEIVKETLCSQSFQVTELPDINEVRVLLKGRFCEVRLHKPPTVQKTLIQQNAPYMTNFYNKVQLVELEF